MGPFKSLKEVRRIVVDCMKNVHPIYRIKVRLLLLRVPRPGFLIFKEAWSAQRVSAPKTREDELATTVTDSSPVLLANALGSLRS